MMAVTGLHHVQVSVPRGSEDAVRAFYCGILGLVEVEKPDALKPRGGLWLAIDGRPALHFGAEDVADRRASKRHVALEVDDLDEVRARLERAGVGTEDGIPIPGWRRFECRDPFGNRLELLERAE
jgi:catechol 2,3-dioxygenase-like lactoylglutathione lyase family enzyme